MIFAWLENKIPRCSFIKKLELADGNSTVGDIKRKFLARYDVDERELENDFVEMIRDLQWKKILTLE